MFSNRMTFCWPVLTLSTKYPNGPLGQYSAHSIQMPLGVLLAFEPFVNPSLRILECVSWWPCNPCLRLNEPGERFLRRSRGRPPRTPKPAAVQSSAEGRRRGQAPAARAACPEGPRPAARAPPGAGMRALETRLACLSCLPPRVDRPPLLTRLAGALAQVRFLPAGTARR